MDLKNSDFPINTLEINHPDYPQLLREIPHPPKLLYYRGSLSAVGPFFYIAAVGSRKMSTYGKQAVSAIIKGLSGMKVAVVSGLALGTDAQAHLAALESGLPTIAVLGSGIDDRNIYPLANYNIAHQILRNGGAIVSAYPPGTPARSWHFPERNQIISGLCRATIIFEAAIKSGALITAESALEQNRDIFALPGSIFQAGSYGSNTLIKNGQAKLISSANDIINEYEELRVQARTRQELSKHDLSENQRKIILSIGAGPASFSQILEQTGLAVSVLNSELILLEIKNKIRALGNNCYAGNLTNSKPRG